MCLGATVERFAQVNANFSFHRNSYLGEDFLKNLLKKYLADIPQEI